MQGRGKGKMREGGAARRSDEVPSSSSRPAAPKFAPKAVPLPEPRTPRNGRAVERKLQRELHRLSQEKSSLNDEIGVVQRAPVASQSCQELVQFLRENKPSDPFLCRNAEQDADWRRWFTPPPRRRSWFCWS